MYVSVVMPTCNRRAYVGQAIESVLKQRNAEFELIVVDDASTDGTLDVVRGYASQDNRIRIVGHSQNKGLAVTLNDGLKFANHDLVARMDDDDIMFPARLRRQVEYMDANPDVSVVSSWAYAIDESGKIIGRSCPAVDFERGRKQGRPELLLELIHPATMYRKRDVVAVGGYRNVLLEDRDLWARLVAAGYKLAVQPDFLMYQRRHRRSLMTADLEKLFEFGDFIDFNLVRRLRGEEELTLGQYAYHVASQPLSRRFAGAMTRRSGIAFRRATMHYSSRDWLPFIGNLALAMSLEPLRTIRRIAEKYAFRTVGAAGDDPGLCKP